jgi:hypothetical protein
MGELQMVEIERYEVPSELILIGKSITQKAAAQAFEQSVTFAPPG